MASLKKTQTTNKVLFDCIRNLVKYSNSTGLKVYKAVANKLSAPASQRPKVNLGHIEKHCQDGETIIVPGKVLGDGQLTKKLTIVGFSASEGAEEKIKKAGSKFVTIDAFLSKKPDNKIRIIG